MKTASVRKNESTLPKNVWLRAIRDGEKRTEIFFFGQKGSGCWSVLGECSSHLSIVGRAGEQKNFIQALFERLIPASIIAKRA